MIIEADIVKQSTLYTCEEATIASILSSYMGEDFTDFDIIENSDEGYPFRYRLIEYLYGNYKNRTNLDEGSVSDFPMVYFNGIKYSVGWDSKLPEDATEHIEYYLSHEKERHEGMSNYILEKLQEADTEEEIKRQKRALSRKEESWEECVEKAKKSARQISETEERFLKGFNEYIEREILLPFNYKVNIERKEPLSAITRLSSGKIDYTEETIQELGELEEFVEETVSHGFLSRAGFNRKNLGFNTEGEVDHKWVIEGNMDDKLILGDTAHYFFGKSSHVMVNMEKALEAQSFPPNNFMILHPSK